MPERPRQHVLEEESNRAFVDALPSEWVARRQDPDYGIDYVVEIFEEGSRSGLSFNAQLKATDEPDLEKALRSIRFPRETLEYYAALAQPVLIVRYHSPSGDLFCKWFHAFDPHVRARATATTEETKSVAFIFEPEDEWTADTPGQLVSGVRGFHRFRQAEHRLPLSLLVAPSSAIDAQELAIELRKSLRSVRDLFSIEQRTPTPEDAVVEVGPKSARVSLADVASITIDKEVDADSASWLATNLPIALALALTNIGQTNLAAQLTAACGPGSEVLTDPVCMLTLSGAFFRSRRVTDALRLMDKLDDSGDPARAMAGTLLMSALLARGSNLSAEERALAEEVGEARLQRRLEQNELPSAASEAYNLAMLSKRALQFDKARTYFEKATELDPSYRGRGYYHADFAGALFALEAWELAEQHYSRALELGVERRVQALAADALIFAGRYAEAADRLEKYLGEGELTVDDAEWRLKRAVLEPMIELAGTSQHREIEAAMSEIEPVDFEKSFEMSIPEAASRVGRAIELDACCAKAWFRKALLSLATRGDLASGREAALVAAVIGGNGVGAWTNCLRFADQTDDEIMVDVIRTAYNRLGSEFEASALDVARNGVDVDGEKIRRMLESAVREVDQHQAGLGFVMRFPSHSGMDEFKFTPPSGTEAGAKSHGPADHSEAASDSIPEVPDAGQELLEELRRRLGDEWFAEAGNMRFEVTEERDVVLHTGKWISFMWGKEESKGKIIAVHRAQSPAHLSLVKEDGSFELMGPMEGDF